MKGYWLACLGLVTGGGLGWVLAGYYLMTRETEIDRMLREGNQKAREMTIQAFREMIRQKPEIGLTEAILRFEKPDLVHSDHPDLELEHLAKSKTRTVDAYRQSYEKYFNEALRQSVEHQET